MAALAGNKLTLEIDGEEYAPEVFSAIIKSAKGDDKNVTFGEAASGGGRDYVLNIKLTQDMAATSLWTYIWENGGSEVDFTVRPYGNAVPTVSQKHMTGTATVSEPDGDILGGDANPDPNERWQIEVEWKCVGRPVPISAAP